MKTTLYLAQEKVRLRLSGDAVIVESLDQPPFRRGTRSSTIERFPMVNLTSVVVSSRTGVTGPLLSKLREHGIALSWVDARGRLCGRMEPHPSRNAVVRRAQVARSLVAEDALAIARTMVRAKIRNQRVFLLRHARRGMSIDERIESALRDAEEQACHAKSREVLMGREGQAARAYFEGLERVLEETAFPFVKRTRRPPRDPINALLSYGYALLAADCASAIAVAGLDPYIGFLHTERWGRAELALDLMEELRTPLVDSLVCGAIRKRSFAPSGFESGQGGAIRMNDATRRRYLELWTQQKHRKIRHPTLGTMHDQAELPLLQARLLGKHLLGHLDAYPPFVWR